MHLGFPNFNGMATVFFDGSKGLHPYSSGRNCLSQRDLFKEGLGSVGRLFIIYAFVAMFWALFDQTGSKWVLQAENMDRNFLGTEWLSSQIQAINPIMIMVFIPIFNGIKTIGWPGLYPLIGRVWTLTPLRKIGIGFFLTVPAFLIPAWIELQIDAGHSVNIAWQLLAYVMLTAAGICLHHLPNSLIRKPQGKSLIMALFLMSVALGNIFVAAVNFILNDDGTSKLADYYFFFAGCMLVTAYSSFLWQRCTKKRPIFKTKEPKNRLNTSLRDIPNGPLSDDRQ